MQFRLSRLPSPVGQLLLATDDQARLRALDFEDYESRMHRLLTRQYRTYDLISGPAPERIAESLARYFAGNLAACDSLPVRTKGTSFQQEVWSALRTVAAGTTQSYGALASRIGRPSASRAVGLANGANPIAIVVPCHRIIGANGDLTGYGGGLSRKRWLLAHERKHASTLAA
ncbi:MAG: methylated-DNA--[protein]-cysteine S-methyltransferase [Blastopirellula sp. JB062]